MEENDQTKEEKSTNLETENKAMNNNTNNNSNNKKDERSQQSNHGTRAGRGHSRNHNSKNSKQDTEMDAGVQVMQRNRVVGGMLLSQLQKDVKQYQWRPPITILEKVWQRYHKICLCNLV